MNTLMIITLAVATPVYALLWHNQDAHPQKEGSSRLERDPVQPSLLFWLVYRFARFARFPAEYRHLAFGLKRQGLQLADQVVVAHSRDEAALKAAAATWLAGPTGGNSTKEQQK